VTAALLLALGAALALGGAWLCYRRWGAPGLAAALAATAALLGAALAATGGRRRPPGPPPPTGGGQSGEVKRTALDLLAEQGGRDRAEIEKAKDDPDELARVMRGQR
jgi:Spy/CpxP family protein refolding chaperone